MQVLLVTICFGVGRGRGGVFDTVPPFPDLLPIAVSFLAIPLCRLIRDPRKVGATERFPYTAIALVTADVPGLPPHRSDARALTARLLTPLQALPDIATDDDIAHHWAAIPGHTDLSDIVHMMLNAAQQGTAGPISRRALILDVTDPRHTDT